MESKIMQIFYGNDCLPYKDIERVVHYPIVGSAFQGASQTTEIRFYIDEIGGTDATWVALAKLPNGKTGSKILQATYDSVLEEHYVSLSLSSFYTQAKGDLYISLQGYDGGVQQEYDSETEIYSIVGTPVIQATGSVKIAINYATQIVGNDEVETITLQEVLALISTKIDKNSGIYLKVVDLISAINTSAYKDYISNNDIVFTRAGRKFYIVSGSYPSFTYQEISLALSSATIDVLNVSNALIALGDAIFHREVRVVNGLTYLTFGENGLVSLQDYLDEKQNVIPVVTISPTHSGTISPSALLNSLARFPSYLTYTYGNDSFIYIHSGTDGTYYYFRKLFKESVISNSTNLIYGGDVYIRVNKSTGAYEQIGEQRFWYSKDQADAKLDLKADKSATYTKTEIDNIIATLEASAYQVVESLPEQGQNGVVYLIETSEGVYEQYVWASGAYIDLGSTQIDLSAYQPLIDSSHKLSADLVDDTNTNNKFVSSSEKATWNAKQNDVCLSVVDGKLCISYEEA